LTGATPDQLASQITALLPRIKSGTLRFFGEWFGREWDNHHEVTCATADGDDLIVNFDEGEELTVSRPRAAKISPDDFLIRNADRARWQWFYYGRPQIPENRYLLEYVRKGDRVDGRFTRPRCRRQGAAREFPQTMGLNRACGALRGQPE